MATASWSSSTRSISFCFPGFIVKGQFHIEWPSRQIRSSALMDRTWFTLINHSSPLPCRYQGHQSHFPLHFIVNYELLHGYHSTNKVSLRTIGIYGMWRMLWALCLAFHWRSGSEQDSQPLAYHTFHDSCPTVPSRIMTLNPLLPLSWIDVNRLCGHYPRYSLGLFSYLVPCRCYYLSSSYPPAEEAMQWRNGMTRPSCRLVWNLDAPVKTPDPWRNRAFLNVQCSNMLLNARMISGLYFSNHRFMPNPPIYTASADVLVGSFGMMGSYRDFEGEIGWRCVCLQANDSFWH